MTAQRAIADIKPSYEAIMKAMRHPSMTIIPEDLTHLTVEEQTIVISLYTEKATGFHPAEVRAYQHAVQNWNAHQYKLNIDRAERQAFQQAWLDAAKDLQDLGIDPLHITASSEG